MNAKETKEQRQKKIEEHEKAMEFEKLLATDCREKSGIIKLLKALNGVNKVFASYVGEKKKVPIEKLEEYIERVCRKYNVKIQYINPSYLDGESRWYSMSFMTRDKQGKWYGNVFGYGIWELFAKASIYLNHHIKQGKIDVLIEDE